MGNFLRGIPHVVSALIEIVDIVYNSTSYTNTTDDQSKCDPRKAVFNYLDFGMMTISIILIILFSFMTKRVSFKPNVCYRRPGLALPMNMLQSHDHIVEYTLAFLSLSEDIYQTTFGLKTDFETLTPIAKFFVKLCLIIGISIVSYPIFVAIYERKLIVYIIAVLVWTLYIACGLVTTYISITCLRGTEIIPFVLIVMTYTGIDFALLFIFLWRLISHIKYKDLEFKESELLMNEDRLAHFQYVRQLLKDKSSGDLNTILSNKCCTCDLNVHELRSKVKERIYLRIRGFRIPPRLIIGLFVGLYFAYRIFMDQILDLTPYGWKMIGIINSKYATTNTNIKDAFKIASGNYSLYTDLEIGNAYRFLTLFYTNLILWCFISSVIIGLLNSIIQSFMILRNYRVQFHRISRRGFSSIISLKHAPSPSGLVSGFVRYSGFQAAYILWGISVVMGVLFVFLFFVIGIILIPFIYMDNSWARDIFFRYEPVIIASFVLNIAQNLIVKYIFVREHGNLMEVNNQRAFMIYTHCAFFLNAIMGIFNSIKRIIVWIFSGVFCFCRIDFCALPTYLQNCDSGYMTFIGFLYTEQYHHNPILKCFIELLLDSRKEPLKYENNMINESYGERFPPNDDKKYRKKWLLAFTLVNNPRLQLERKKNIVQITEKVES